MCLTPPHTPKYPPPSIDDLRHMSAVRSDQHDNFAEENDMSSFLMSAKSGDQVKQVFNRITCSLVGAMPLLANAVDSQTNNVVKAIIVDHKRYVLCMWLCVCVCMCVCICMYI